MPELTCTKCDGTGTFDPGSHGYPDHLPPGADEPGKCPYCNGTGRAKECTCMNRPKLSDEKDCPVHPPSQETKDELDKLVTRWSNRFALIGNKEVRREVCKETGDWTDHEELKDWNEWLDYDNAQKEFKTALKVHASTVADKAVRDFAERVLVRGNSDKTYLNLLTLMRELEALRGKK